jgi:hypothetical protein
MTKQDLFNAIEENFYSLEKENAGTTKASQQRARKAAMRIKNLITAYKKASVQESK